MISVCTFATLALLAPQEPGEVLARFFCHPERVEVGEPFRLVLEFSHPAGTSTFDALESQLELDESWVILGEERRASEPDPEGGDRLRTRRAWTIASLEPSEVAPRGLTDPLSRLVFRGDIQRIETTLAVIDVTSVLGESQEPRPLAAFPESFGRELPVLERSPWLVAAGAAMGFFWIFFFVLLVMRRKRRPTRVEEVPPIQELRKLVENPPESAEAMREELYELTGLLRRSFDGGWSSSAGWTDREWLEAMRSWRGCPPAALEHMTRLVQDAERYKYGGSIPSDWALRETYASARMAVEVLEQSQGADSKRAEASNKEDAA